MARQRTPEELDQAVAAARHHWSGSPIVTPPAASQETVPPRITIAISREYGAQGGAIANEIGTRLDWPVYDRNILDRISDETDLRAAVFARVDECDPNWLADAWEGITGKPTVADEYMEHLPRVLLSLAYHGNCVIVGRGATFILPRETTLNILCISPLEERVARIAAEEAFPEDEVQRHIEEMDHDRKNWVRTHFHKDPEYAHLYDLVFNTTQLSVAACADMAIRAVQDRHAALQVGS